MKPKKRIILIILDGWGIGEKNDKNAVELAETKVLDNLKSEYPTTSLICSGNDVGLPHGTMGNSEVGHLNIGAGRIVYQDLLRINNSIADGSFSKNSALNSVMDKVFAKKSSLHIIGLLSDGGVHSHIKHLFALCDMANRKKIKNFFIHPITDGRDTPPDSGLGYMKSCVEYISELGCGKIASICGRYFAMCLAGITTGLAWTLTIF